MPRERLPRPRFRLQFNLRTLFALLTVVALGCGWFGTRLRDGIARREAVRALREAGATIGFHSPRSAWQRWALATRWFDDDIVLEVAAVNFNLTPITDDQLAPLIHLTELSELRLNSTQITDTSLANLRLIARLEVLDLANTQITGSGLKHCVHMKRLRWLALNGTQLNDESTVHLSGHTQLQYLYLYGTPITDRCISDLFPLQNLDALVLNGTNISGRGEAKLKRACPQVNVYREGFQR